VTPAVNVAKAAKVAHTVHRYDHDPAHPSFGEEAAEQLGVDAGRVFKTLVVDADGRLCIAVLPVAGRLDLKAAASALAAKRVDLAEPSAAERATGYVVGGISPLGQKKRLATVIDASATAFSTVYVSAGRRGLEIELAPADLIALTGAVTAPIVTR